MNKKRILFISDSIFSAPTGVSNVAINIVTELVKDFNLFLLGVNLSATDEDCVTIKDYSQHFNTDSQVLLLNQRNFGTNNTFEFLFSAYKFDAVLILSDPHFHTEFFKLNHKVKQICPIIWYNIWDSKPIPYQNLPYYDSCDTLLNISSLTQEIVEEVLGDKVDNKIVKYVPHGVNLDVFYNIVENSPEYFECKKFKKKILGDNPPKFMLFFNSKNIRRKNIGTLLETYKLLLDEGLDIGLLMHTGWTGDYSLDLYIDAIFGKDFDWNNKIFVTNQVPMTPTQMRWLYNMCDLTVLTSYNEGWGLSLTESLACDKPFVAPNIGGMSDQIKAVYDENYWIPALDVNPSIKVSTLFEPLYQSYVDPSDVFNSIMDVYNNTQDCYGYRKVAEKYFDSKVMSSTISKYIKETIENFVPHKKFTITKC